VAPDLNVLIIGSGSQLRNATVTYRENENRAPTRINPLLADSRALEVVHALLGRSKLLNRKALACCVGDDYSGAFLMRLFSVCAVFLLTLSAAPLAADARGDAKKQVEFGISVAQRGLWREAIYRWERAVQIDPTYAAAHNNLAIAYEHEGELDKARAAYEKAVELEPGNSFIKQNYELFKEINDRTTRQDNQ
jgi:tetratricopeptide (TPR) repeat protein